MTLQIRGTEVAALSNTTKRQLQLNEKTLCPNCYKIIVDLLSNLTEQVSRESGFEDTIGEIEIDEQNVPLNLSLK